MKAQILFDRVNHFHLVVRIKKNVVYKYSKPETNANAVSSHEADRFEDVSNSADLSACGAPDNVKGEKKDTNRMAQLNADRSIDAVRFKEGAAAADLSASERPVYPFGDNVNKGKKSPSPVQQNADRSGDAARFSKKDAAWFEEHKWETIDLANFRGAGKAKKPVPHRHFAHLFNSYTRYFNRRTGGTGNLFERPFKRKPIHNESYLKKVILYVHNNPIHHGFCNHLLEYPWSSYIACISEKPTKLNRKSVLNLFNERDGFKKQHNHKVDIKNIEKYLNLDEVDYTTKINDLNADISNDAIPEKGNRIQSLNTVRSNDADRLTNESTKTDLTASERPVYPFGDNVNVNIAAGFPVWMAMLNQRNRHTHAKTGLKPHLEEMRLKPELPRCILIRQLKQTAMDNLYGNPNLQGLKTRNIALELKRKKQGKLCTNNNRKTGLNESGMNINSAKRCVYLAISAVKNELK